MDFGPDIVWGNVPPGILPVTNANLQLEEQKSEWSKMNVDNIKFCSGLFEEELLQLYSHFYRWGVNMEEQESAYQFDVIICKMRLYLLQKSQP